MEQSSSPRARIRVATWFGVLGAIEPWTRVEDGSIAVRLLSSLVIAAIGFVIGLVAPRLLRLTSWTDDPHLVRRVRDLDLRRNERREERRARRRR
ncbi:MAG: hypothetical protein ACRDKW_04855 [Actinomycetota bacterium]